VKQVNHYFKCSVGDELRMFRDVDLDAIGLYVRLRLLSFDNDPSGFFVDAYHRPVELKRLADAMGEKNARFQNLWSDLRTLRLVQSVAEYSSLLERLAERNRRTLRKQEIFTEIVRGVWPDGPASLDHIHVIPQLVDQLLDTMYGAKFGRRGGNPSLLPGSSDVVNHVDNHPSLTTVDKPQMSQSDVKGHRSEVKDQNLKKEKSPASALAHAEAPWSWPKHMFETGEVRKWEATLTPDVKADESRYLPAFFAHFGYTYEVYRRACALYEHGPQSTEIPQSCLDGHHVREDNGSRCRYCREFVGEAASA
jgi:hypothetical protein